jgi:hypothetical protein
MLLTRVGLIMLLAAALLAAQSKPAAAARPPEAVAQALVEAFNAHDVEAILKTYSRDSIARRLPSGEAYIHGHPDIRKKFATAFEKSPKVRVNVVQRMVHGDFVIDREKITGAAGSAEPQYGVVVYEIKDGLIQNEWYLPRAVR